MVAPKDNNTSVKNISKYKGLDIESEKKMSHNKTNSVSSNSGNSGYNQERNR